MTFDPHQAWKEEELRKLPLPQFQLLGILILQNGIDKGTLLEIASLGSPGLGKQGGLVGQGTGCKRVSAGSEGDSGPLPACLLPIPLWASSALVCNILLAGCSSPAQSRLQPQPLSFLSLHLSFSWPVFRGTRMGCFPLDHKFALPHKPAYIQANYHPTSSHCSSSRRPALPRLVPPKCRSPGVAHKGSLPRHPAHRLGFGSSDPSPASTPPLPHPQESWEPFCCVRDPWSSGHVGQRPRTQLKSL
ncbi:hypothetical protein H1C71_004855 [Ictidomys tridecemlineatus]|nr:hypothetical protein H1C71_004855 [Ictidomys tridecemlineatus]